MTALHTQGRDEQAIGLRQVLDEMDREYGVPSAGDHAWARQVLGV
ncbi:MAG TPA: hypothetical protein VGR61_01830 [Candidatus Dormibacteraeota bacterium]|nr:hypothetical protein [Candidatus Dormibacteraeota bacterium]